MLHYIASHAVPMPDLSEGLCVGSKSADDWHADMHREAQLRRRAKAICLGCPVMSACQEYALLDHTVAGTWGALTEQERIRIRAAKIVAETVVVYSRRLSQSA